MLRKLIVVGLLSYGAYYLYNQSIQSQEVKYRIDNFGNTVEVPPVQVVKENDLQKVKDVPHTKETNLLYDNYGNERVRIHHIFTSQVVNNVM